MKGALLRTPVTAITEKVRLQMDPDMLAAIDREARRQGRTRAWIIRMAWLLAQDRLRRIPAPGVHVHLCDVCRERGASCSGEHPDNPLVDCTRFVDLRSDLEKRIHPLPER